MKIQAQGALSLLLILASAGVCRSGPEPPVVQAPPNPVQQEMRVLHEATRGWVTAIANNTLALIPASIGEVHKARLRTEEALQAGTYKPPKNSAALAEFARQDDAFHNQLVKLIQAAKADDLPRATRQLGVVLQGCTSCHARFRF